MKLKNLCIYELRKLAREIGVKSPTSLKRADLIEKINSIKSGKELPYKRTTKKGRPVKQLNIKISNNSEIDFLSLFLSIKENNLKGNKQIDELLSQIKKHD